MSGMSCRSTGGRAPGVQTPAAPQPPFYAAACASCLELSGSIRAEQCGKTVSALRRCLLGVVLENSRRARCAVNRAGAIVVIAQTLRILI